MDSVIVNGVEIPKEFEEIGLSAAERSVLAFYRQETEDEVCGRSCYQFITDETTAEKLGLNLVTVKRAKERLCGLGMIDVVGEYYVIFNNIDGIFIPFEFYKYGGEKGLNVLDLNVLALYRCYTLYGDNHCCEMSNEKVCEKFGGRFGVRNLRMIKKKLKDLGLIKTDGGIKVWYLGFDGFERMNEMNEIN